jgi:hypothetical protein
MLTLPNRSSYDAESDGVIVRAQRNVSAPIDIGSATVEVSTRGPAGSVVAVLVPELVASQDQSDLGASLASDLVSVHILGPANDSDPAEGDFIMPTAAFGITSGVVIRITMPVTAPNHGNGSCVPTSAWSNDRTANHTCVAGCCIDSVCSCRLGFTGALCDQELRCALVPVGGSTFDDGSVCATHANGMGEITCVCSEVGSMAVLNLPWTPVTNTLSFQQVSSRASAPAFAPGTLLSVQPTHRSL